jgi:Concanavalin A-like lectin/glucanases superfamily/Domain of unknown function (DUF2341)
MLFVEPADPDLAMHALINGGDIAFLDASGARAPHELEGYASSNGAIRAWVRVPLLRGQSTTTVTMIYGSSTPEPSTSTQVWDASFEGVYHFSETSPGPVRDSTAHARHGVLVGTPTLGITGKIGTAFRFAGGASYVTLGGQGPVMGTSPWTLALWARATSSDPPGRSRASSCSGPTRRPPRVGASSGTAHRVWRTSAAWSAASRAVRGTSRPCRRRLRSLGVVCDGANIYMIAGGAVVGMQSDTRAMAMPLNTVLKVGCDTNTSGGPSDQFPGEVDEVRISSMPRSSDWVAAEHANQNDPLAGITVGPEVHR